ncbi:MAG: SprT family zinc-dependent metalloprotease [Alphaproteobacteria bacterium]
MSLFRPAPRYAHGDRFEMDGAVVRLRVDARARRVSLRIDQGAGEVVATAPNVRRLGEAVDFAKSRAVWIAGQMVRLPESSSLLPGQTIEVLGAPCRLEAAPGRGKLLWARDEAPMRIIAPEGERFTPTVLRLLKAEARRVLAERTAVHAQALGQPQPAIMINDPKGRWGSCTPARKAGFASAARVGRIRYSWRLILAPFEVLDYVAAHECAHLIEANHGPKFWALVETRVPNMKPHRKWLRDRGAALHAFGRG